MKQLSVVLCGALVCAAPVLAAQSAGTKEDLSVLAGKMLDETNQARQLIKNGQGDQALKDVEQARSYLSQVQAHADGATIIPVYREFVSISVLTPVQTQLKAQRADAEQSSKRPVTVHQVASDYTDVTVNTTVAQQNLTKAEGALKAGNTKIADAALADVQEGVSIDEAEANLPLERARENLILARAAIENGQYTEAHDALHSASKALATYGQEASNQHASEARSLQQQIDTYDQNMKSNHASAVSKINQWWNETSDWTPYVPADKLAKR